MGENAEEVSVNSIVLRQRAFMHDISGALAIAQGMLDMVMSTVQKDPKLSRADIERLQKSMNALEKLTNIVAENREFLIFLDQK